MKKKYVLVLLMAFLCTSFIPGCMFVSPYFKDIRNQILDELGPFDVDTEVQIRIGPGLISFGGFVASFTKVDGHTLSYLRDIRNVEVGVYNLKSDEREKPFSIPNRVSKILARKGYEPLVKSKDKGETENFSSQPRN